jgi:branched-subunit amino acid transport protein
MESALKLWAVIVSVGALNYVSRVSFIALLAKRTMPPLLARALRYVPAAMLTALIVPMVVDPGVGAAGSTAKIGAAVIATVVAYFKLGTLWTLGVGMGALWLLNWWL